jgi:thymidylate synthase (FAD)
MPDWLYRLRDKAWRRNGWVDSHSEPSHDHNIPPYHTSRTHNDDKSHDNLTRDVAFNRHSYNDGEHVSPLGNGRIAVGLDGIDVRLVQGLDEEQFKRTMSMATRATVGWDPAAATPGEWVHCKLLEEDYLKHSTTMPQLQKFTCEVHSEHKVTSSVGKPTEYLGKMQYRDWEEMLKGGLQTALETQVVIFAVSGVSRTATHQLVRSRRASFHQSSQRASYLGDQPEVRIPESVWNAGEHVRTEWLRAIAAAHHAYRTAAEADVSYQDARFILPEGTNNYILLEYPLREFLNVYAYRACSMFQWEIVSIIRECGALLTEQHPWLEPYIKISCEKTGPALVSLPNGAWTPENMGKTTVEHHCTFQGWEQVEGQCPFAWAKEEARTFKPAFHQIKQKGTAT